VATGSGDNGAAFFDYPISPSLLVEGRNVIAVEVHQNSITSSDLMFDVELRGVRIGGAAAYNITSADRMARVSEALSILTMTPEFSLQN
jgi:hypothetical protein